MLFPDDARKKVAARYRTRHREWLVENGQWPMSVNLGMPTGDIAAQNVERVTDWIRSWRQWSGPGRVAWQNRRWRILGNQQAPERLLLESAADAAACVGELSRWRRAKQRYGAATQKWPGLGTALPSYFAALADWNDEDFERLLRLLDWLERNPASALYLRQIPLPGMDTKWIGSRVGMIADLFSAICGERGHDEAKPDGHLEICGLIRPPAHVRLRILDADLRAHIGGLSDLSALPAELARLAWRPTRVFIIENLQTALAFNDIPGAIVIFGSGYGMDFLGCIPWLTSSRCIYWGDIDTHGFAILNQARRYLSHLESVLMDETTLMANRGLWVSEPSQHSATTFSNLTVSELELYQKLKAQMLGQNVRLEQERISWANVEESLSGRLY